MLDLFVSPAPSPAGCCSSIARRLGGAAMLAGLLATGACFFSNVYTLAAAQGLVGTTLRPVEERAGESLIGGLLSLLGGGDKREAPSIEGVVVTEDAARRLAITITYSGLGNLRLSGEVQGQDRRRQAQIAAQPVVLSEPAGDATLAFELQPSVADGTTIESAYVRLIVTDPARSSMPVMTRAYALPKAWQATPAPANVVLRVAPAPLGTAAKLGSRPDYAPPPRVLVPRTAVAPPPMMIVGKTTVAATARLPPDATVKSDTVKKSTTKKSPSQVMQRQDAARKTEPAAQLMMTDARLMHLDRFQYGVKPEDVKLGAEGPSASRIELLEGLRTEDIGLNPALLLNIATGIYPDKNPKSGVFYYHPRSYHLEWTPENGHGMRILYGATGDASAGDVLMAARLQSGLDASEVQLATDLLNAYKNRNKGTVFTVLRPLPIEKDGVDVSLDAVLGQYSIPAEKIAITGLSDVLGEIEVRWVTDPVTKENVQLALMQDLGVSGDVIFNASGGALAPQVRLAIQLADRYSFGRVRWNRAEGHRNLTPYPIRLRYLHALIIDPRNHLPILYSWSLDNVEVPPQARVEWDAARVPAWIDTEARRVWVDYAVVGTCDACDRQVIDAITGGVSSIAAEQITFHTITPLADVGGYEITAHVRSKYFDPKDREQRRKTVVLTADSQDFTLRPIYNATRPDREPLFEYMLDLTMPDGTTHSGRHWIPSDTFRVLIGRAQLERSLGMLPGKAP